MLLSIPQNRRSGRRGMGWIYSLLAMIVLFSGGAAYGGEPLKVVTTTTILQDLIEQVAGERAEVWSLVRPGMDPHAHQAVPADLVALSRADAIFVHGARLDAWADRMVSGRRAPVFVVAEGIEVARRDGGAHAHHGHEHDGDPHFWFDPNLVVHYIERIEAGLSAVDPDGARVYRENASAYIEELQALDAWIRARVAEVPEEKRKLVTNHDSFGHFAERYGFEIVGAVIPSFNPEAEPSARQLSQLVRVVRELGVSAIFTETTFSPRLAEAVAREAGNGVRVVPLYTDSLSPEGGPASTYVDLMKYNVSSIVDALK